MKLLLDMNLSPRWCAFLNAHGLLALHWLSVGAATASDADILAYAHRYRCVLLTADVNLAALAELTRRSTISVVQIGAPNLTPEVIGDELIASLRLLEKQLLAGALVQVRPRGAAAAVPSRIEDADTRRPKGPLAAVPALITGGMPGAHGRSLLRTPQPAQA